GNERLVARDAQVARVLPLGPRRDDEIIWIVGGQVLRGVDREVRLARAERVDDRVHPTLLAAAGFEIARGVHPQPPCAPPRCRSPEGWTGSSTASCPSSFKRSRTMPACAVASSDRRVAMRT